MNTTQQTTVQDGHSYIMHPVTLDMVRTCYTDYEFLRCQCEQTT